MSVDEVVVDFGGILRLINLEHDSNFVVLRFFTTLLISDILIQDFLSTELLKFVH
jgi:hypothetical protein